MASPVVLSNRQINVGGALSVAKTRFYYALTSCQLTCKKSDFILILTALKAKKMLVSDKEFPVEKFVDSNEASVGHFCALGKASKGW